MKRFTFLFTLLSLFCVISCQQESLEPAEQGTTVNFSVAVPGEISTKAVADGNNVDELYYAIYKYDETSYGHENGVDNATSIPLASGRVDRTTERHFNVTFDLLADQNYVAIFWAQKKVAEPFYVWPSNGDLRTITFADKKDAEGKWAATANLEDRAAFFRTYVFNTTTPQDHVVDLYRPFAQLNLGTTLASLEPKQAGANQEYVIDVKQSQVKVTGLATEFNTISQLGVEDICGKADEVYGETFVFTLNDVITASTITDDTAEREYLTVKDKEGKDVQYEWIAMNYFFATENCNVKVDYEIVTDKGVVTNTVDNVPVKENFRTNIIGNLLTSNTDFEIVVNPYFEQPDHLVHEPQVDYTLTADNCFEVYTVAGLAKWAYHVNFIDNTTSLRLMDDITLPNVELVKSASSKTYAFSDKEITVTDGIPSYSNWVPVGNQTAFHGFIEGNGHTIRGIRINTQDGIYTGFISKIDAGDTQETANPDDVYIKDLNIDDVVVYSKTRTGALCAYVRNIKCIDNCHVSNASVTGAETTGGIVGYLYTRHSDNNVIMSNSTLGGISVVKGTSNVGGLVGMNYGSIILGCTNASDVYGVQHVGGVVGYSRDYHHYRSSYVIGCGNTGSVSATHSVAGGIVGMNLKDNSHQGSEAVVVACWSTAPSVTAPKTSALLVATEVNSLLHYGSWAIETADLTTLVEADKFTGCYAFTTTDSDIQSQVDEMNAAIISYNTGRDGNKSYCPYIWDWTAGSLPVLK